VSDWCFGNCHLWFFILQCFGDEVSYFPKVEKVEENPDLVSTHEMTHLYH